MTILVDTNILVRLASPKDTARPVADRAVNELRIRGEVLCVATQSLIEFRAVATRPVAQNGLGLSAADAGAEADAYEAAFTLLADTSAIFPTWKSLVSALGVLGKQVHDARLVAVCHVHQVSHILTFNVADFTRFATHPPGLVVLDPRRI